MLVRDYPGIRPPMPHSPPSRSSSSGCRPAQARHITAATRRVLVTAHVVTINLRAPRVKVS